VNAELPSALQDVVSDYAAEAAFCWASRDAALTQPHFALLYLDRIDRQLIAQLDGLATAGDSGAQAMGAITEESGALFAPAVLALQSQQHERLRAPFALAEANATLQRGLISAFGWVEPHYLRGIVKRLLSSQSSFHRVVGIRACAQHRMDPGLISARLFDAEDPAIRARALRTAGDLGKVEWVSTLTRYLSDEDPACRFWAARSAVLLGDRERALERLAGLANQAGPLRASALKLALQFLPLPEAHTLLQSFAHVAERKYELITGAGYTGDPKYIPWIISLMSDDATARAAGEAFSLITGVDLALLDLERKPPEDFEPGPNDDPEDTDVAMDWDDGLPWPDEKLVQGWWKKQGAPFTAGTRYFMGATLSRAHCINVLKTAYQRQRIAAAHHLCALSPGTPLFEWRAPSWRQAQELAQLK
jgi:uncharacterized protein (TIGR02270 family)